MYEGGMLVTRHAHYEPLLNSIAEQYAQKNAARETIRVLELLGYWLFYRPLLFWFVFTLPQQVWRVLGNDIKALREDFALDFPVHAVSRFRTAIAHSAFSRLDGEIARQRSKAAWYIRELAGCRGVRILEEDTGDRATYPYVTLVFDNPAARNLALKRCSRSGAGVSQIYARAIADYPYLKSIVPAEGCCNARLLAERTLTLSTSTFLAEQDAAGVAGIIRDVL
jgi:dTDP-4-amino-4,6-dideoxygalactose transaminase